jgi:DNA-binding MarR family transcriptional regulator
MENLSKSDLLKMKKNIEKMLASENTIDDLKINVYVKKDNEPKIEGNKWLFLFQDTEFLLARILSARACQLIMLFRAICKYENQVSYDVKEMMKLLGVTRQTISKALAELKDKGIVLEFPDPSDRRKSIYYINPESQWKGKIINSKNIQAIFDSHGVFKELRKQTNPGQLDLIDEINKAITDSIPKD